MQQKGGIRGVQPREGRNQQKGGTERGETRRGTSKTAGLRGVKSREGRNQQNGGTERGAIINSPNWESRMGAKNIVSFAPIRIVF